MNIFFPWDKARVVLHNSMEGSGNEFGKELRSVHRSHSKIRDMSLKVLTASSSFKLSHLQGRDLRAQTSRIGILPQGGIYVSVCNNSPSPLFLKMASGPLYPQVSI